MGAFVVILGLLIVGMAVFMIGGQLYILKKGEHVRGEICEISDVSEYRGNHAIIVQFMKDGEEIRSHTLNSFALVPFFEKYQLSILRRIHVGRKVHIYYNPDRKGQVLIREYIWKEFILWIFLLAVGIILVFA